LSSGCNDGGCTASPGLGKPSTGNFSNYLNLHHHLNSVRGSQSKRQFNYDYMMRTGGVERLNFMSGGLGDCISITQVNTKQRKFLIHQDVGSVRSNGSGAVCRNVECGNEIGVGEGQPLTGRLNIGIMDQERKVCRRSLEFSESSRVWERDIELESYLKIRDGINMKDLNKKINGVANNYQFDAGQSKFTPNPAKMSHNTVSDLGDRLDARSCRQKTGQVHHSRNPSKQSAGEYDYPRRNSHRNLRTGQNTLAQAQTIGK
jgi:hypothetical protein